MKKPNGTQGQSRRDFNRLVALAVGGMLAGASMGCRSDGDHDDHDGDMHSCKSEDGCSASGSCKGEGGCSGADSCKGEGGCGAKDACKGEGGCGGV